MFQGPIPLAANRQESSPLSRILQSVSKYAERFGLPRCSSVPSVVKGFLRRRNQPVL
jgi:hypothetical protein